MTALCSNTKYTVKASLQLYNGMQTVATKVRASWPPKAMQPLQCLCLTRLELNYQEQHAHVIRASSHTGAVAGYSTVLLYSIAIVVSLLLVASDLFWSLLLN